MKYSIYWCLCASTNSSIDHINFNFEFNIVKTSINSRYYSKLMAYLVSLEEVTHSESSLLFCNYLIFFLCLSFSLALWTMRCKLLLNFEKKLPSTIVAKKLSRCVLIVLHSLRMKNYIVFMLKLIWRSTNLQKTVCGNSTLGWIFEDL